jgi:hypothetical protein
MEFAIKPGKIFSIVDIESGIEIFEEPSQDSVDMARFVFRDPQFLNNKAWDDIVIHVDRLKRRAQKQVRGETVIFDEWYGLIFRRA